MAFHRSLQNGILKRPEHAQYHESLTNLQQPMLWPPCFSSASSHPSPPRVVLPLFASLLSPLPVCPVFYLSISRCGRFCQFSMFRLSRADENWKLIECFVGWPFLRSWSSLSREIKELKLNWKGFDAGLSEIDYHFSIALFACQTKIEILQCGF